MFIHYTFTSNTNHSNYVWTCYHTLPNSKNMVGYNATRYHNSNALRYALPHALLYILSQFNIDIQVLMQIAPVNGYIQWNSL